MTVQSPGIALPQAEASQEDLDLRGNSDPKSAPLDRHQDKHTEKPYIFAGDCDRATRSADGVMRWQKKQQICTRNSKFA